MSGAVSWGILGTGSIARQFAEGLRHVPGADLRAVASRDRERAESFARGFGQEVKAHESYEDLVADEKIDVVYVATPNMRHRADSLLSLEAGKAVLCEKPFALNAREAREVIAAAREKKLFCMEAMWMRFVPSMVRARSLVKDGALGEARMLTADFGVVANRSPASRLFDPSMGGGVLLDLGVYTVSLAYHLMGQPVRVTGSGIVGPTGVDEQIGVVMEFAGGNMAILSASFNARTPCEATLTGTKARLRIHSPIYCPQKLTLEEFGSRGGGDAPKWARGNAISRKVYEKYRFHLRPRLMGSGRKIVDRIQGNGYNYEALEATRCLQEGHLESEVMPLDESLRIMETLDTLRSRWGVVYPGEDK